MLKSIKECFSTLSITLVADALYAKKKLLRWCVEAKVTMITRPRSDAALFKPVRESKTGTRGRPPIKRKTVTVSIGDILYQLKSQCVTQSILSILPKDRVSERKIEQLQELFSIAA